MQVAPFEIERYYERWEFTAELMLSSSDCQTRSLGELLALEPEAHERLLALQLGYTEAPGSQELRDAVAGSYEQTGPEDVLALAAAEEGIFLAYHALLGPGDRAIVETPCYGSAHTLVQSTGAQLDPWVRRFEDGWRHDLDALRRLVRAETRIIYINTPHNPTGMQMPAEVFDAVLDIAREQGIAVFSDEVYRGLEHDEDARLPAACDRYERALSLGTVSKAHGLPGLRVGWLGCRDPELLARIRELKLYTTICCSAPSELLVALALRHEDALVAASRELVLSNLPLVAELIARRSHMFEWVAPQAGPIGFPRVSGVADVHRFCEDAAARAGVLLLPGSVYEEPSHVRVGFGRDSLPQAIARLEQHLDAEGL